jgi:hypothetical protein
VETIESRYKRYLENSDQMESDAAADAAIDLDDALPNILRQASLYLSWSQLASIAESQVEAMKQHFEVLSAECRERAYEKLTLANEKTTEQRIKDAALRDPAVQRHLTVRRSVELFAQRLKCVQKALEHKKDMLIQIGARQRAELSFYPNESRLPDLRTREDTNLDDLKAKAQEVMNR